MSLLTGAVSVATILGSGILGLPVSLAHAGLPPFVTSFSFTLVAQIAVVYATTELLQRATAARVGTADRARRDAYELLTYQAAALHGSAGSGVGGGAGGGSGESEEGGEESDGTAGSGGEGAAAGLHTFAELFLPGLPLKVLFEAAVLFHFVSIMSSYALGAPQAFREVFPALKAVPETATVLAFTVLAGAVVIFFADAIVVPLTVATFVKGTLLTFMVCFVLAVGFGVGERPRADWSLAAGVEPFLMGTLALSGVINLMPKLWDICVKSTGTSARRAVDAEFVVAFRAAVNVAVALCYVLNVMWCAGVLLVVPQTSPAFAAAVARTGAAVPYLSRVSSASVGNGTAAVSLARANALGQISTVPLVQVLKGRAHGAAAALVINMVNVFIFISISVSFLVMGIGMCQMLDEMADSAVDRVQRRRREAQGGARAGRTTRRMRKVARAALASLFFAIVSAISASNPKALLHIMAGITSLALNLEGGVLIIIMFVVSRQSKRAEAPPQDVALDCAPRSDLDGIPAPVKPAAGWALVAFVVAFFGFAVVVDVVKYIPTMFG